MVNIDSLLGHVTAIGATTMESGSQIGNSLKTIYSRVTTLPDVEKALKGVGIAVKTAGGEARNVEDVFNDLASKWGSLTNLERQNIAVKIAGRNHLTRFLALMNNYDMSIKATNDSINSQGSAMKENAEYQKSLEARLNRLKNTLSELAIAFGETFLSDGLVLSMEGLKGLAQGTAAVAHSVGTLGPVLGLAAAGFVGYRMSMRNADGEARKGVLTGQKYINTLGNMGRAIKGVPLLPQSDMGKTISSIQQTTTSTGKLKTAMEATKTSTVQLSDASVKYANKQKEIAQNNVNMAKGELNNHLRQQASLTQQAAREQAQYGVVTKTTSRAIRENEQNIARAKNELQSYKNVQENSKTLAEKAQKAQREHAQALVKHADLTSKLQRVQSDYNQVLAKSATEQAAHGQVSAVTATQQAKLKDEMNKTSQAIRKNNKTLASSALAVNGFATASNAARGAVNLLKTSFMGLVGFLGSMILPAAAFMALGFAIEKLVTTVADAKKKQEALRSEMDKTAQTMNKSGKEVDTLVQRYEQLSNKRKQSGGNLPLAEEKEYFKVQQDLGKLLPSTIEKTDELGRTRLKSADAVKKEIEMAKLIQKEMNGIAYDKAVVDMQKSMTKIKDLQKDAKAGMKDTYSWWESALINIGRQQMKLPPKFQKTNTEIAESHVQAYMAQKAVRDEFDKSASSVRTAAVEYLKAKEGVTNLTNKDLELVDSLIKLRNSQFDVTAEGANVEQHFKRTQDEAVSYGRAISQLPEPLKNFYTLEEMSTKTFGDKAKALSEVEAALKKESEAIIKNGGDLSQLNEKKKEFIAMAEKSGFTSQEAASMVNILAQAVMEEGNKAKDAATANDENAEAMEKTKDKAFDLKEIMDSLLGINEGSAKQARELYTAYQMVANKYGDAAKSSSEYKTIKDQIQQAFPAWINNGEIEIGKLAQLANKYDEYNELQSKISTDKVTQEERKRFAVLQTEIQEMTSLNNSTKAYNDYAHTITENVEKKKALLSQYEQLAPKQNKDAEDQQRLTGIIRELGNAYPGLITSKGLNVEKIREELDSESKLAEKIQTSKDQVVTAEQLKSQGLFEEVNARISKREEEGKSVEATTKTIGEATEYVKGHAVENFKAATQAAESGKKDVEGHSRSARQAAESGKKDVEKASGDSKKAASEAKTEVERKNSAMKQDSEAARVYVDQKTDKIILYSNIAQERSFGKFNAIKTEVEAARSYVDQKTDKIILYAKLSQERSKTHYDAVKRDSEETRVYTDQKTDKIILYAKLAQERSANHNKSTKKDIEDTRDYVDRKTDKIISYARIAEERVKASSREIKNSIQSALESVDTKTSTIQRKVNNVNSMTITGPSMNAPVMQSAPVASPRMAMSPRMTISSRMGMFDDSPLPMYSSFAVAPRAARVPRSLGPTTLTSRISAPAMSPMVSTFASAVSTPSSSASTGVSNGVTGGPSPKSYLQRLAPLMKSPMMMAYSNDNIDLYQTDYFDTKKNSLGTDKGLLEAHLQRVNKLSSEYREILYKIIDLEKDRRGTLEWENRDLEIRNNHLKQVVASMGDFYKLNNEQKKLSNDYKKEIDDNIKKMQANKVEIENLTNSILNKSTESFANRIEEVATQYDSMINKIKNTNIDYIDFLMNVNKAKHPDDVKNEIDYSIRKMKELKDIKALYEDTLSIQKRQLPYVQHDAELTAKLNEEIQKTEKAWRDTVLQVVQLEKSIKDMKAKVADDSIAKMKDYYAKARDITKRALEADKEDYRRLHDEKIKMYDEEIKKITSVYDTKIKGIQQEKENEDLQEKYDDFNKERVALLNKINALSLDDSMSAKKQREALFKELSEKEVEYNKFVKDTERDKLVKSLEEQREAQTKHIEDKKTAEDEYLKKKLEDLDFEISEVDRKYNQILENDKYWADMRTQFIQGNFQVVQDELTKMTETMSNVSKYNFEDLGVSIENFSWQAKDSLFDLSESISNNLVLSLQETLDKVKELQSLNLKDFDSVYGNRQTIYKLPEDKVTLKPKFKAKKKSVSAAPSYSPASDLPLRKKAGGYSTPVGGWDNNSLDDYLKQKGYESGWSDKEALYSYLTGSNDYKGTANQNIDLLKKLKELIGFESGGYTGSWQGNQGKLALLHQKELVLNQGQTRDVLKVVQIIDKIKEFVPQLPKIFKMRSTAQQPQNAETNYNLTLHIDKVMGDKEGGKTVFNEIVHGLKKMGKK